MAIVIAWKPTAVWAWTWILTTIIAPAVETNPLAHTAGHGDWWLGGGRCFHEDEEEGKKKADSDILHILGSQIKWWGQSTCWVFYFEKVDFPKSDSYSKWVFPIRSWSHMYDTENPKHWAAKAIQSDMLNCSISFEDGSTRVSAWKSPNYVTNEISTYMVKYCWKHGFLLGHGSN